VVSKDPGVLELSTTQVAERLITLVDLLHGGCDVLQVVAAQPRLLTWPDIRGSYQAAVGKLAELHPARSREVAVDAVQVGGEGGGREGWVGGAARFCSRGLAPVCAWPERRRVRLEGPGPTASCSRAAAGKQQGSRAAAWQPWL
jgi:hypothetical protein